jgi:hypothetical protein
MVWKREGKTYHCANKVELLELVVTPFASEFVSLRIVFAVQH